MKKYQIERIQFIWFWGKPLFHWWVYPLNYKDCPAFQGKPIMWRLALGFVEIRIFPKRKSDIEL